MYIYIYISLKVLGLRKGCSAPWRAHILSGYVCHTRGSLLPFLWPLHWWLNWHFVLWPSFAVLCRYYLASPWQCWAPRLVKPPGYPFWLTSWPSRFMFWAFRFFLLHIFDSGQGDCHLLFCVFGLLRGHQGLGCWDPHPLPCGGLRRPIPTAEINVDSEPERGSIGICFPKASSACITTNWSDSWPRSIRIIQEICSWFDV